jgi:ATP-dependent exoDNAse (exonuclease V) beta subunit
MCAKAFDNNHKGHKEISQRTQRFEFGKSIPCDPCVSFVNFVVKNTLETVEQIYRLFQSDFPEYEQAYIQAFFDLAATFTEKNSDDTGKFLKWWEETGCKEKIITPDSQDAIRILTIHKSKGLGFKVVIIPFGDWETDQKIGSILWCHPQKAPFDRLSVIPVNYSKELSKTLFAADYYHEKLHAFIDNLNALYVAFTRAKEELIIFVPDAEVKRRKAVSKLIDDTLASPPTPLQKRGESEVEWGTWQQQGAVGEAFPFPLSLSERELGREAFPFPLLRLRRNGNFFDDKKRKHGILMHEILSNILTKADIRTAIMNRETAGEIDKQESAELTQRLEQLLDLPDVRKWFDGSMQVLNETEILYDNGQSYRPDRMMFDREQVIVVDYKFGEQENPHDRPQVKKYISLIRETGYPHVKGYLWYIALNKIVNVTGTGHFNVTGTGHLT